MNIRGRTIIITGASTGVGEATAKLFATHGAIVYNIDIKEPKYSNSNINYIPGDVADHQSLATCFNNIFSDTEKIDFLFANAGIHLLANLEDTSLENLDKIIDINLKGTLYTLKLILPIMKKNNFGCIVLMGSDQSFVGRSESAVYGATKGAIGQLTKSTAIDYAKYNIRVNCVCPGPIDTSMYHNAVNCSSQKSGISQEVIYSAFQDTLPIKRLGSPEEVANVVAFLCSDNASFMTGALIAVDGGMTAQ